MQPETDAKATKIYPASMQVLKKIKTGQTLITGEGLIIRARGYFMAQRLHDCGFQLSAFFGMPAVGRCVGGIRFVFVSWRLPCASVFVVLRFAVPLGFQTCHSTMVSFDFGACVACVFQFSTFLACLQSAGLSAGYGCMVSRQWLRESRISRSV